jgi:hypothetical protein
MLKRHLSFVLGAVLAVTLATGVSAAEDNPDTKRCGGYYACIELQPSPPDPVQGQGKFSLTNPGSAHP